jgi:hypothetical protein
MEGMMGFEGWRFEKRFLKFGKRKSGKNHGEPRRGGIAKPGLAGPGAR